LLDSAPRKRDELIEHLLAELGCASTPTTMSRSLTADELTATAGYGVFDVGSHSMTHTALALLTRIEQALEIEGSKTWLEGVLQRPVAHFSYPFGTGAEVSRVTRSLVRRAGYEAAVANVRGVVEKRSHRYALPRILVRDSDGAFFEEMLLGLMGQGFG
jgi:peptidoglycan/xylan/chitin deacetylase (PgdA/CDA1 family)